MKNKRNSELIEKINNLLNSDNLTDEQKMIVTELKSNYESVTYADWQDRHKYYQDIVSTMVNDCGFDDDGLANTMAHEHPTLQQSFMRMCRKFIEKMAGKTYWDERNEHSVMMAKKMMEAISDNNSLPFI